MSQFDEIINRRGTDSFKYDFWGDNENIIPMPVADMDFKCPEPILAALKKVTDHGIFGYSYCPPLLESVFIERIKRLYNWQIKPEWLVWLPGLEVAITNSCKALGEKDDSVITPIPIYHPFHLGIGHAKRKIITTSLIEQNKRLTFNFDEIERSFASNTRLFLLCNPQNPGGTVFRKDELEKLSKMCIKNNVVVCSDEIHCDLLMNNSLKHVPFASLNYEAEQNSITLMSPSKTFNIAGLGCSVAIIPNPEIRKKFNDEKAGIIPFPSRHSYEAALAAYKYCDTWHQELLSYLQVNHEYLLERINKIEGLKMLPLEGTYLAWIKCGRPEIKNVKELLLTNGVRILEGEKFLGATNYFRLNFACPKLILNEAINRIEIAFSAKVNS